MQAGWYRQEIAEAQAVVARAKHHVDFLIPRPKPHGSNIVPDLIGTLFPSDKADGLKIRVVLSNDANSEAENSRKPSRHWLFEELDSAGINDLRFTRYERHFGIVMVDGTSAVVVDENEIDVGLLVQIYDAPTDIAGLSEFFESTWTASLSGPSEVLYQQLLPPYDPKSLRQSVTIANALWGSVIHELRRRPEDLYAFSSRKFEELIAHLIERWGYSVVLTPQTRDGGKDILVTTKHEFGEFLFLLC